MLLNGEPIVHSIRSVQRYTREAVLGAVEFIISLVNIKTLSWGTKKMIVDKKQVDFPRFTRLKTQEYMYRDYIEAVTASDRISHGSFAKLVKILKDTHHIRPKGSQGS